MSVPSPTPPQAAAGLERLGDVAQTPSVGSALAAARELLGMALSYVTEHSATEQVLLHVDGDAESFGVGVGSRFPLDQTYCQRILDGALPPLIPDVAAEPIAAAMPVTAAAGVGAYVSVPIRGAGGVLAGTLCCASHHAEPDLAERDLQFLHVLARVIGDQMEADRASRERQRLQTENAGVRALLAAVEARDSYTAAHSRSVVDLAGDVARELGCDDREAHEVELVALLHDIGKLRIPDAILRQPGPLSDAEWDVMRTHSAAGAAIVAQIPELAGLTAAIRAEHERWDGTGYPDGLAGDAIPLASRVTLVCDAYHAMTSDRPYRAALGEEAARAEVAAGAGTQFCPTAAAALLAVLSRR
ncbi:HD domain-containing protein [Paraconexibacter antarcticus]|uniref:HD domain-containing protein n=1 Tax=Paraconexibacter antarcticus TaxID=2949664 RepID=A0ABY5DL52_9ACTN|nr:HD family phosphohydrolase [Paraconexibacter antarcticus]UTI62523.1 HD domain-containing protein [Paraconexibacter antarcticus]